MSHEVCERGRKEDRVEECSAKRRGSKEAGGEERNAMSMQHTTMRYKEVVTQIDCIPTNDIMQDGRLRIND